MDVEVSFDRDSPIDVGAVGRLGSGSSSVR